MTNKTFGDYDAIKELWDAVRKFQHIYLGRDDDRSMIRASEGEVYRTLSPLNKTCFRRVAGNMQNVIDWTREIDADTKVGDVGRQKLPDLVDRVLRRASEERK
jgi:hypothetical protein